ncbi:MAG: glycoside hydrolase family 3 protein, partial [Clostridia bacterium]|nr:glycoside hydrolase family 3 protein [Clostridia bacterium]
MDHRKRAEEIVSKMTLAEKMSQMRYDAPPIERLGIPGYNWWNEGLHGVARSGSATSFPQAIGLAATFDPVLIKTIGSAISSEARAKYNGYPEYGAWEPYVDTDGDGMPDEWEKQYGLNPNDASDA